MSGFTGLVLREGRFVIKKMCSFRKTQIRVDGALMFNATLYMYKQHVTSLRDIFRLFSLRLVVFLLFLVVIFCCFFLSWLMFLDLSYQGCHVYYRRSIT